MTFSLLLPDFDTCTYNTCHGWFALGIGVCICTLRGLQCDSRGLLQGHLGPPWTPDISPLLRWSSWPASFARFCFQRAGVESEQFLLPCNALNRTGTHVVFERKVVLVWELHRLGGFMTLKCACGRKRRSKISWGLILSLPVVQKSATNCYCRLRCSRWLLKPRLTVITIPEAAPLQAIVIKMVYWLDTVSFARLPQQSATDRLP